MKVLYLSLIFCILYTNVYGQSQFIKDLMAKMTVEDKCGQMTQVTFDVIAKDARPSSFDENPVDMNKLLNAVKQRRVGSILNTPYNDAAKAKTWQAIIKSIQDVAISSNLGIPVLYGLDSIHGANYIQESTLFPQPINIAASFNVDIAAKSGRITAEETRAVGIPWNFNPSLDVGRNPIWPRLWEAFGESQFVGARMGEAYVKAHQGDDLTSRNNTATCLKHFIGYGLPLNGRDRTPAYIPENMLREIFLPPYEAAVAAGSQTVMINSGEVNGIPGHANSFYINEILKGELKFEGFVVSDWEDINRLYFRDHVVTSNKEAVRRSVMAGLDMSMVPYDFSFTDSCIDLVKSNDIEFSKRVDDAVLRILKVKEKLGLWSNSSLYPVGSEADKVGNDESHAQNLEAARETIILAKNKDNILPLKTQDNKKILVTGPTGNLLKCLNGGWTYTWQGDNEELNKNFGRKDKKTVFEAIRNKNAALVDYKEGVTFNNQNNDISSTVELAKNYDIIVLTIGEATYTETPGTINSLLLNQEQYDLANALFALKKPVILVYLGGRPRIITEIAQKADGIILGFLPGNRGGEAIADIMFGDYNPNGRLPVTYPNAPNGFMTYDHKYSEIWEDFNGGSFYYDRLFSFGHGLSYTQFKYSNIKLSSNNLETGNEKLTVRVDVQNVGSIEGKETVILYLNDEYGSTSRPVKEVKGFKKISLKPNEKQTVSFILSFEELSFINYSNKRVVEDGKFNIYFNNFNESATFTVGKTNPVITTTTKSSASKMMPGVLFATVLGLLNFLKY